MELNSNNSFKRTEKKFWMSRSDFEELEKLIGQHITEDEYGMSLVNNIYCDTDDYLLIRKSVERPDFKEKLRIRYYGEVSEDCKAFAEIKRKVDGTGFKRRLISSFDDIDKLLKGQAISSGEKQIECEIISFAGRYLPRPKIYISYRRQAFFDKENPGLRISFDENIRWNRVGKYFSLKELSDLKNLSESSKPLEHNRGEILMEIKSNMAVPRWLLDEINRLKIYQAPFSKVGTCYTNHIAGKENNNA